MHLDITKVISSRLIVWLLAEATKSSAVAMSRLPASDLIRVAELITLGAETAKLFSAKTEDGEFCRIIDAAKRIEAASRELAEIGRELKSKELGAT